MTRSLSVLFLAACVGGGPALAQDAPPPPQIDAAMPAPATVERGTRAAGASFLARRFGVSEAEAQRRLALDEQIAAATQALREAYGDDLVGLFIDHEPNYRVTYVFSREVAAGEVQQQIDGALRPHAAVRRSRFGTREIAALPVLDNPSSVVGSSNNG